MSELCDERILCSVNRRSDNARANEEYSRIVIVF